MYPQCNTYFCMPTNMIFGIQRYKVHLPGCRLFSLWLPSLWTLVNSCIISQCVQVLLSTAHFLHYTSYWPAYNNPYLTVCVHCLWENPGNSDRGIINGQAWPLFMWEKYLLPQCDKHDMISLSSIWREFGGLEDFTPQECV